MSDVERGDKRVPTFAPVIDYDKTKKESTNSGLGEESNIDTVTLILSLIGFVILCGCAALVFWFRDFFFPVNEDEEKAQKLSEIEELEEEMMGKKEAEQALGDDTISEIEKEENHKKKHKMRRKHKIHDENAKHKIDLDLGDMVKHMEEKLHEENSNVEESESNSKIDEVESEVEVEEEKQKVDEIELKGELIEEKDQLTEIIGRLKKNNDDEEVEDMENEDKNLPCDNDENSNEKNQKRGDEMLLEYQTAEKSTKLKDVNGISTVTQRNDENKDFGEELHHHHHHRHEKVDKEDSTEHHHHHRHKKHHRHRHHRRHEVEENQMKEEEENKLEEDELIEKKGSGDSDVNILDENVTKDNGSDLHEQSRQRQQRHHHGRHHRHHHKHEKVNEEDLMKKDGHHHHRHHRLEDSERQERQDQSQHHRHHHQQERVKEEDLIEQNGHHLQSRDSDLNLLDSHLIGHEDSDSEEEMRELKRALAL